MNANAQMGGTFADAHEAETWEDENKDIANLTHPFSGNERNRLFLSRGGKQFLDISGLSGVDSPADGRVSVWFDYDHDGWLDLAVINSSSPLLQIYHNEIGDTPAASAHSVIGLRLFGANAGAIPSDDFSTVNAIGARVRLKVGERTLYREKAPFQGLAGQNSDTMYIGLGEHDHADGLEITWPSGLIQNVSYPLKAGTIVTVPEETAVRRPETDTDPAIGSKRLYGRQAVVASSPGAGQNLSVNRAAILGAAHSDRPDPELLVVTTMASWCTSCARHQPSVNELRAAFTPEQVEVIGFAADPEDPADAVREFLQRHKSAYPAIVAPTDELRADIDHALAQMHASDALPNTVIVHADGRVLAVEGGIPSISRMRQLLDESPPADGSENR